MSEELREALALRFITMRGHLLAVSGNDIADAALSVISPILEAKDAQIADLRSQVRVLEIAGRELIDHYRDSTIATLRAQVETLKGEIKSHRRHIQTAEINRNTVRNGAFKEAIEAVRETTDGNAYSVAAIRALISKSESDQ